MHTNLANCSRDFSIPGGNLPPGMEKGREQFVKLVCMNGRTVYIKLVFSRLAKNSGMKRLHAHLCRHTFAINYLMNGGDIFSLWEILGQSPTKLKILPFLYIDKSIQ